MTTTLTPAQHAILAYALEHTEGRIEWFPDNIKGGARQKVLDGLSKRSLINALGTDWFVAAEGYEALGIPHKAPVTSQALDQVIEAATPATTATPALALALAPAPAQPRTRENSKQATVVQMLQRPEGATIAQICEATGWQAHTVRGAFAGALKKKLGLTIVSDKVKGGERVYRSA